jgi:hypothetical protein
MDAEEPATPEPRGTPAGVAAQIAGPAATTHGGGLGDVRAVTLEQLAAVHALLGTERRAREYDILFSTALESLRDGPQTEAALLAAAQRVWPGAGVDAARINQALQAAAAAGYIAHVGSRTGPWTLTQRGHEEVAATRDWASDTLRRTAEDIRARLEAASRPTTIEEAQLWVASWYARFWLESADRWRPTSATWRSEGIEHLHHGPSTATT